MVAAPQDKDIVQGLDNGDKYGDGDDDGDANDDGYDEDGGEVRQRPKPPHHCPHKSPGSPRGEGERGGVGWSERGNWGYCYLQGGMPQPA